MSFYYSDAQLTKQRQVGFVAQDLEKVIPEVVVTKEDGFKSVAYSNIVAVVVGALKEMYHKLTRLIERNESRIEKMERQIALLQKRQEALEEQNEELRKGILGCDAKGE